DRRLPTRAGQARRHVFDNECGPRLCLCRRRRLRPRPDDPQGRRWLHPLRGRESNADGARRDPTPRRQRLHQRLSDPPPAARREALRDRRRHQRNQALADWPGDHGGGRVSTLRRATAFGFFGLVLVLAATAEAVYARPMDELSVTWFAALATASAIASACL